MIANGRNACVNCDTLTMMRDMAIEHGRKAFLVMWRERPAGREHNEVEMAVDVSAARSAVASRICREWGGQAMVLGAVELR